MSVGSNFPIILQFLFDNLLAPVIWGERGKDGNYDGMLGQVQRGECDLVANYFTITHQRAMDFDYSISYFTEG